MTEVRSHIFWALVGVTLLTALWWVGTARHTARSTPSPGDGVDHKGCVYYEDLSGTCGETSFVWLPGSIPCEVDCWWQNGKTHWSSEDAMRFDMATYFEKK